MMHILRGKITPQGTITSEGVYIRFFYFKQLYGFISHTHTYFIVASPMGIFRNNHLQ